MEFIDSLPLALPIGGILTWLLCVFLLLRYGRKFPLFFKSVAWLVVIAAALAPIYMLFLGGADRMERAAAPDKTMEGGGAARPKATRGPATKSKATKKFAYRRALSGSKNRAASRSVPRPSTARGASDPQTRSNFPGGDTSDQAGEEMVAKPDAVEFAEAPAPAEAPKAKQPFDTVSVYFGTDRKRGDTTNASATRVAFSAERGRELTLGKADITVPKSVHEPGIVERPWEVTFIGITIYREKEDPKKHFTISEIGVMSEDEFFASVNAKLANSERFKDQALVFVHGFNVAFTSALYRTAQIVYDLKFDGAPFLYSWPSRGALASYENDQNNSEQAERYLRSFLEKVMQRSNARQINLIAHSMGNKPLLNVLQDMQVAAEVRSDLKINQIVLAAPDVDRHVFEDIAREITAFSNGVTLYASSNDRAMKASRAYAGEPRAGDISENGPVIVNGVDTIDVSAMSMAILGLNHSTYAERSELLADIGRLMLTGVRPPKARSPAFQKIETDRGAYWRYPIRNQ